jgi:hypothetical protein
MNCWDKFINWLNMRNIPKSERSLLSDLAKLTDDLVEKK